MKSHAEIDAGAPLSARVLRWMWLLGCMLIAGGLWGVVPSLARIATSEGASPLGLAWWQGVGGGLLLLTITFALRRRLPLSRNYLVFYVVCGVIGTALPSLLLFNAAQHVAIGVIALIMSMVPMMTYLMSVVIRIDSLSPRRILGILLGFAAVILVVAPQGRMGDATVLFWVLLALIIPIGYSFENIYVTLRRPPGSDAISLVSGMLLAGALILTPAMLLGEYRVSMGVPWRAAQWATLAMIIVNVVSYVVFLYLINLSGPVFASQAGYFTMIFGVFWGMALFAERYSAWVWAALCLTLVGLALVKERRFDPQRLEPG